MGCFEARRGAFFCALTAAMGGKGKDGGTFPGALAAGGAIGGANGAGFGACANGCSGPLPMGGIIDGTGVGAAEAAGGCAICGARGGAIVGADGARRGACSFAAGIAGTVDFGIEPGDAL